MPEWLKDLLPYLSPLFGVVLGWLGARNTKAFAIRDATIKHLELLLSESRRGSAEAVAAKERVDRDCEEYEKRAAVYRDEIAKRDTKISGLLADVSGLKAHIDSHPPLLWWNGSYREAEPKDGKKPRWFCAECWEKRHVYSELTKIHGDPSHDIGACRQSDCTEYNILH